MQEAVLRKCENLRQEATARRFKSNFLKTYRKRTCVNRVPDHRLHIILVILYNYLGESDTLEHGSILDKLELLNDNLNIIRVFTVIK